MIDTLLSILKYIVYFFKLLQSPVKSSSAWAIYWEISTPDKANAENSSLMFIFFFHKLWYVAQNFPYFLSILMLGSLLPGRLTDLWRFSRARLCSPPEALKISEIPALPSLLQSGFDRQLIVFIERMSSIKFYCPYLVGEQATSV